MNISKVKYSNIINLDYLTQISNGNKKFISEMVGIFISEIPYELEQLENAIQKTDFSSIKQLAHKLKSSLPFVGLDKLIDNEVSEMERLGHEQSNINVIELHFFRVKEMCSLAAEELKNC